MREIKDLEATIRLHDIAIDKIYNELDMLRETIEKLEKRVSLLEVKVQQLQWQTQYKH
jgi:phage shock protein A